MLAVLGSLADVDSDLIRTRTLESKKRRQGAGAVNGATPPAFRSGQQKDATRRRAEGARLEEIARSYNVGVSTIRRATRAA